MMKMYINAENLILGRVASFAAKKALLGEEVIIVNAEKAVITGSKKDVLKKIKGKLDLHPKGNPLRGPKFSRMPDRMLRKAIKGMLPTKKKTGRDAFRRVKVYIAVPEEMENAKIETVENAKNVKMKNFMLLGDVSKLLGAKW